MLGGKRTNGVSCVEKLRMYRGVGKSMERFTLPIMGCCALIRIQFQIEIKLLLYKRNCNDIESTGGLVGYDDWFTPSRSGVRFPPGVNFACLKVFY